MSGRPRGRPRKKSRKNQQKAGVDEPSPSVDISQAFPVNSQVPVPHKRPSWKGQGHGRSMSDFESDLDPGEESDEECEGDNFSELDDEDFAVRLVEMAEQDDSKDADWIPPQLRQRTRTSQGAENLFLLEHC